VSEHGERTRARESDRLAVVRGFNSLPSHERVHNAQVQKALSKRSSPANAVTLTLVATPRPGDLRGPWHHQKVPDRSPPTALYLQNHYLIVHSVNSPPLYRCGTAAEDGALLPGVRPRKRSPRRLDPRRRCGSTDTDLSGL